MMQYTHEVVGFTGAFPFLCALERSARSSFSLSEVLELMESHHVVDAESSLHELVASDILHQSQDSFALTRRGIHTCILLEAINGADLRDIYHRLQRLDSSLRMYELIREGMTKIFLKNINDRPGFGRLYFCSPWISLDKKQKDVLVHAVHQYEKQRGSPPEILVITRPEEGTDKDLPETLAPFRDLGAQIFLNKRLHTKLYIREPDTNGGYAMAIVGSQNLTKSSYLELGIRINSDSHMISHLVAYFLELTNSSYEL
jgi:hypothetical protein